MVALSLVLVGLFVMGSQKEYMLLNINRTSQLYKIADDSKRIENVYTFLFQNTDAKDHSYYFELSNSELKIEKPTEPFVLKAGQKVNKIVILSSSSDELSDETKNLPVNIKAFAVDEKEKIWVERKTIFIYPKKSEVKP